MSCGLTYISNELQKSSASKEEIALPFGKVILAINELREKGIAVISWEPWLVFSDGTKRHPNDVMGMVPYSRLKDESWSEYVNKSCDCVIQTITIENVELESSLYRIKYPDITFYYCIVVDIPI